MAHCCGTTCLKIKQQKHNQPYNEIQRVAGGDPRIYINDIVMFPQENGMLVQIQLQTVATTDAQILSIFFNQNQRSASYI